MCCTWNLYRTPQVTHRHRKILGGKTIRHRARAYEVLERLGVVSCQPALGPHRHLISQQRGQQRPALVRACQRRRPQRRGMWRADHGDGPHHPGMQHRRRPADQPTVGVADERGRRVAQSPDQPGRITGQRPAVIPARRFVATAVAAKVDGHDAGVGQARQLMAPRPPERAEAVQQDHQWSRRHRDAGSAARFRLDDVEPDPVGVHLHMPPRPPDPDD